MATKITGSNVRDNCPPAGPLDVPKSFDGYGASYRGPSSLTPGQTASSKLQASPPVSADLVARRGVDPQDSAYTRRESHAPGVTFGHRKADAGGAPSGKIPGSTVANEGEPVRKPSK